MLSLNTSCYIMKFLHVKHTVYVDVNEKAVIVRILSAQKSRDIWLEDTLSTGVSSLCSICSVGEAQASTVVINVSYGGEYNQWWLLLPAKNNSKVAKWRILYQQGLACLFQNNDPNANDLKNNPCSDNRNKGSLIHGVIKSLFLWRKNNMESAGWLHCLLSGFIG